MSETKKDQEECERLRRLAARALESAALYLENGGAFATREGAVQAYVAVAAEAREQSWGILREACRALEVERARIERRRKELGMPGEFEGLRGLREGPPYKSKPAPTIIPSGGGPSPGGRG